MPFRSRAQVRKFYALKKKGKMSQSEIDKWTNETPSIKSLPERIGKKKSRKRKR
jgi:hypothetical protein